MQLSFEVIGGLYATWALFMCALSFWVINGFMVMVLRMDLVKKETQRLLNEGKLSYLEMPLRAFQMILFWPELLKK